MPNLSANGGITLSFTIFIEAFISAKQLEENEQDESSDSSDEGEFDDADDSIVLKRNSAGTNLTRAERPQAIRNGGKSQTLK